MRESGTDCSCSVAASVGQTESCGQGLLLLEEGILVLLQVCVHAQLSRSQVSPVCHSLT